MPAAPKTGPTLFLGLELSTDQLRASIVDESLELVGVECVDFDVELPEFQCATTSIFGHCYTTYIICSFPGHRVEYLRRLERRTLPRLRCGSRLSVSFWDFFFDFERNQIFVRSWEILANLSLNRIFLVLFSIIFT